MSRDRSRGRGDRSPEREPSPPSREAWRALGPYARTQHAVHALGHSLALDVPGDVFSTQRIDEGTQLLLAHLPSAPGAAPASFLDLGCGYGALGLPVAARFPSARALLVDRDLLAVAASAHNAAKLGLRNVEARGSLGYRDLELAERFDWILCNVPARIGAAAIGHFLEEGRQRLSADGELRIVVIRDLAPVVREACAARALSGLREIVHGPRHSVFALGPLGETSGAMARSAASEAGSADAPRGSPDAGSIYARDTSALPVPHGPRAPEVRLARPHDASEDPRHAEALALLFSTFPRASPGRVLAFRCGFGGAALASLLLWDDARVVAQERDLLDADFLSRNARALLGEQATQRLHIRPALFPLQAAQGDETFALVAGELSPSAPEGVATREAKEARALLAPKGQALLLAPSKLRGAIEAARSGFSLLLERGPFAVFRAGS